MFESALLTKSRSRRRWAALPAAIGVHLTVLVLAVGVDYWSVRPVEALPENSIFFVTTPPPPAPLAPLGSRQAATRPSRPEPVQPVDPPAGPVQPEVVTDLPAPDPVDTSGTDVPGSPNGSSTGVPDGSDHGSETGIPGGSDIGVPNSLPPLTDNAASDQGPIYVSGRVVRPELIEGTRVTPRYPEPARRAMVRGSVILEAVIDRQGNVTSVRVLRGLPMGLDKAAIEAVSQWKFRPATLDGKPVEVYFNLTVNYTVER